MTFGTRTIQAVTAMSQLAESRCSLNFAKARRALQDADKGVCPIGTYYPADLADVGLGHPACFAVFRWLAASFEGNSSTSCETSLLSASKLPIGDIESDILELAVSHGQAISCQLSAKHTCKGAGGRRVSQEQDEVKVTKKGPDSWLVTAEVWQHLATNAHPGTSCYSACIYLHP